ncbi:uncharacterized protein [Taeniopygia guttata]|uniref:uncharacterized protein n=1 Tax=Taeniopygia guttata TaxID=59729 RepID=UPI003BB91935
MQQHQRLSRSVFLSTFCSLFVPFSLPTLSMPLWCWRSSAVFGLRLARALGQPRSRTKRLPRFRPLPPGPRPVPGSTSAFPAPSSAARQLGRRPRAAAARARSGSRGRAAGARCRPQGREASPGAALLGSGGCGSVCCGTRLAHGAPGRDRVGGGRRAQPGARLGLQVAIKGVSRDRISERAGLGSERGQRGRAASWAGPWERRWGRAGVPGARRSIGPAERTAVSLELALLWLLSCSGFRGVVRLLDWFEMPDGFALGTEHPEAVRTPGTCWPSGGS